MTLARVSKTIRGPVVVSSRTVAYSQDELNEVIAGLLGPKPGAKAGSRDPVAVGLSMMRVFFATRAINGQEKDGSPKGLLHEILRSSNVNVDDMEVDMIKAQPGKKPLASLISCRRKYLAALLTALGACRVRPHRAEPAPFALLRLAALKHRAPRKSKAMIRVFLGESQGVAILAAGGLPMVWRTFELTPGNEAAAVRSATKALQLVGRYRGEIPSPDTVFIHGRIDLNANLGDETFRAGLNLRAEHFPDPGYDALSIATGLAVGCRPTETGFDLLRTLKPPAPLWQVIPFGELALQFALLLCITLYLHSRAEAATRAHRVVRSEAAKHPWMAKVSDDSLAAEKKELTAKVNAIRDYLATRVLWNTYTRDMSSKLPDQIRIRNFFGRCELEIGPKKAGKAKKELILLLSATMPEGSQMPREIDTYLNALRADALLRHDFPVVELADLRWLKPRIGSKYPVAEFSVACVPKTEKAAPKAPAADKSKAGH